MVHLYRLIASALLFLAASAFADGTVPLQSSWTIGLSNGQIVTGSSVGEVCANFASAATAATASSGVTVAHVITSTSQDTPTTGRCFYDQKIGNSVINNAAISTQSTLSCPANSVLQGGSCTCDAGYNALDEKCRPKNPCPAGQHEEGGACVPDRCQPDEVRINGLCVKEPPCPAGTTRINGQCKPDACPKGKSAGGFDLQSESVQFVCDQFGADSCLVRVKPTTSVSYTNGSGQVITSWYGEGFYTGAKCSGGSTNPGSSNDGGNNNGGGNNGGNNNGGNNNGGNTGGGNTGGGNTGGGNTGGGNTGGGNTGGGNTGGGNTGGGNTGGGNTGGGNTGGGNTGGGNTPTPNPNAPAPHPGESTSSDGSCPPGTVKVNGRCYPTAPVAPDGDGKCPPGYVRVEGGGCSPVIPTGGNTGGGSTGGGNGNGSGTGNGNGDGDGDGDGESGFGGSCMAGFACEGDAIQCAIAKEQHRRACKLFDDTSAESELYGKEKGKEGEQTKDLPGNKSETMTGRINMSDAFGSGGQCIQDLSVTVMGQSVNLPFSKICPSIAVIGNIMVAVSLLLAARILIRG